MKGNAELLASRDPLVYELAEAAHHFSPSDQAVVADLAGFRLTVVEAELDRRAKLLTGDSNVPDPHDHRYETWAELAREIRGQANIVSLLETAGCWLERSGKEWAGPCPACGGTDRFRVWDRESGRRPGYWCRLCQISGDAISAYQAFLVPGASFYDAVRVLALELGLQTPDHGVNGPRRIELAERVSLGELRHAG